MRIAVLCSNLLPIDPDPQSLPKGFSGASERVMWRITEGMVKRGHDVTLFASGDSKTRAKLHSVYPVASIHDPSIGLSHHVEAEHVLISECYRLAKTGAFDLIHSSFDTRSAYYADFVSIPTVATLHSPLVGIRKTILSKIPSTQWYVSISNAQRNNLPELRYVSTVYHGIEGDVYTFSQAGGEWMMCAGRIAPEKGTHTAVLVARETGKSLGIFGTYEQKNEKYWQSTIAPYINHGHIIWRGMMPVSDIVASLQGSKVFLLPIEWEEPFGLVMIEALACGTPCVAFARGSAPEIIHDGVTGFLVNPSDDDIRGNWIVKKTGYAGFREAVERVYAFGSDEYRAMRRACRDRFEHMFTVDRMLDGYESVYRQITQ